MIEMHNIYPWKYINMSDMKIRKGTDIKLPGYPVGRLIRYSTDIMLNILANAGYLVGWILIFYLNKNRLSGPFLVIKNLLNLIHRY